MAAQQADALVAFEAERWRRAKRRWQIRNMRSWTGKLNCRPRRSPRQSRNPNWTSNGASWKLRRVR